MKKIIAAIFLGVLILAAFNVLSAPRVSAQTSQVKIVSYYTYETPLDTVLAENAGDLVAVGEIQNVGSDVIGYVDVAGAAFNSTGGVLNKNEVPADGYNLLPGQEAPFYIDFLPEASVTGDNTYISNVTKISVNVSYVSDTNSTPYTDLTVPTSTVSASDATGTFTVSGTVQNKGTQTVSNVVVITSFYNASGQIESFNITGYLTSNSGGASLPPGDFSSFTATPTDNTAALSREIANYSFLIQSSPFTTTTPTSTPPPTTTSPTSTSNSTKPTQLSGLMSAVIYGGVTALVIIVVAALLFLRKRSKTEQAEPPPPPPPLPPPPPPP